MPLNGPHRLQARPPGGSTPGWFPLARSHCEAQDASSSSPTILETARRAERELDFAAGGRFTAQDASRRGCLLVQRLCGEPRGAADYCRSPSDHTFIIVGIPVRPRVLKRRRVRHVIDGSTSTASVLRRADAEPAGLYPSGDGRSIREPRQPPSRKCRAPIISARPRGEGLGANAIPAHLRAVITKTMTIWGRARFVIVEAASRRTSSRGS